MFDEPDPMFPEGEWSPEPDDDDPATWPRFRFDPRFGTVLEYSDNWCEYGPVEPPSPDVEPGAKIVSFGTSRGTCTLFPDGRFEYTPAEDCGGPAGGGG